MAGDLMGWVLVHKLLGGQFNKNSPVGVFHQLRNKSKSQASHRVSVVKAAQ